MDAAHLSAVASALSTDARAGMVTALMGGTAHTGRELARHVGVAPSTASEHLGVLQDAGLVEVEVQGRHRYFRLAGAEVASMVEGMLTSGAGGAPALPKLRPGLRAARSCYDHVAGVLGVALHDRLVALGAVEGGTLTAAGHELLSNRLGVEVRPSSTRPMVKTCLDWSQRRSHLGGVVGARLLSCMFERDWLGRVEEHPRELRVTDAGRRGLADELGVAA